MIKKILLVLLGLIVLLLAIYGNKISRVYKTTQFFEHEQIVENFRTTDELMSTHRIVPSTQPVATPSQAPSIGLGEFLYKGKSYSTQEYLDSSFATAFIVSQHDTIRFENYFRGHSDTSQQIVWSVSKSFLSALFGIAIDEGQIKSVKQKVEAYCPELIGTGYEGVLIEDVLQISTGGLVQCSKRNTAPAAAHP